MTLRNTKGEFQSIRPLIAMGMLVLILLFVLYVRATTLISPCSTVGCQGSVPSVEKARAYEFKPLPQNKALYDSIKNDPIRREIYMTFGQSSIDVAIQALAIAQCESSMNSAIKNKTSSASGIFQFIDGTWRSTRKAMGKDQALSLKLDASENIQTAYVLYKKRGWNPWECKKVLGI